VVVNSTDRGTRVEKGGARLEITGVRQRDAWQRNVLPPVEQVRPGLWSIPVPIPGNPLRYVLVYAFACPDGVTVIDAGWEFEESWDALVAGLAQAGYRPADVRAILLTHMHPDHVGLAVRLRAASGAWIGMHRDDAALVEATTAEQAGSQLGESLAQLAWAGTPQSVVASQTMLPAHRFPEQAGPEILFEDGDRIDLPGWDLHAVWTPGHTPGHLCFHERNEGILVTGDHVLPRITPNISVVPGQLPEPLGTYLDSLRSIAEVEHVEVCPAHEYRFRGLRERVGVLLSHHGDRLTEIEKAVAEHPGSTCWELTSRLAWSRPFDTMTGFLVRLAVRETLAHLLRLAAQGRLRSSDESIARWYPVQKGSR
jgi:glyoxylase-like metal-dependent hydrolase (beta-lactamase superfamily II)